MKIDVKVTPNARTNEVIEPVDNLWRVKVMAPPEKGAANCAVIKALAAHFNVPTRDVILLKGESTRLKTFLIELN